MNVAGFEGISQLILRPTGVVRGLRLRARPLTDRESETEREIDFLTDHARDARPALLAAVHRLHLGTVAHPTSISIHTDSGKRTIAHLATIHPNSGRKRSDNGGGHGGGDPRARDRGSGYRSDGGDARGVLGEGLARQQRRGVQDRDKEGDQVRLQERRRVV